MAQLDPSIILSGQPMNMLGILDASNRMAGEQKDRLHQQEYRNMLATNGAGIMSGDQNALNALAGYDPAAALGIQSTRQEMDFSKRKMGILDAQERREAEKYAMGLSAEQRAAEAQQIEDAVKMGLMIPDAATWDQTMATMAPDLVGQFDNRQALAYRFMEWSDVLKQAFPEPAVPMSSAGKLKADLDAGRITPEQFAAEMSKGNMSFAVGPDGTVNFSQGAGGGAVKPFTEAQSKDVGFATRMRGAEEDLAPVEDALTSLGNRALDSDPTGWARGMLQSEDYQKASQAGKTWILAFLRKDSGAAVTPSEESTYGTAFLPQPGDGAAVIQQKRKARQLAMEAVEAGMSPEQAMAQAVALSAVDAAPGEPATGVGALTPGAVEDGYRFKGGDPSDPANWEQVQ